jgi:branched-chain amino acid transport system ATP-binding protein
MCAARAALNMALLEAHGLTAFYGDFQALYGIDLALDEGETVAIIGANGAGKSTFLKTVAGLLRAPAERVVLDGMPIGGMPAAEIVRLGVSLVPEGRRLFPSLSVEENLKIGTYGRREAGYWSLDRLYDLFPALAPRRDAPSQTLSGGEQQMAAIGRALMANPRVLLCDEISLGLAPIVIRGIYAALPRIKANGASIILVEQDIVQALKVADRVYCFQEGRVALAGRPSELSAETIHAAYFGT